MINSILAPINAFLAILNNIPFSVFSYMVMVLAFNILLGVIKIVGVGRG